MFDFLNLRKSVEAIGGKVAEQRAALEKLKRRREEIAAAPPAKDDVIRLVGERIDSVASSYPEDLQRTMTGVLGGGKISNVAGWHLGFLLPGAYGAGNGMSANMLMPALAFLLNDELKQSVRRAVERMEWSENAIPLASREKELSRLDAEIGKLEKELTDLSSEAAKAGISLG